MKRLLLLLALVACSVPETQASVSSQEEKASWQKLGVVQGLPEAAASGDGILAPSLLELDGVLHLWFTQKTGTRHALFHATSHDQGATFAEVTKTTGLGEAMNAYPSVWLEQGSFKLLFGSGSIKRASSADGINFTLDAQPQVLSASFEAGRFDALSVLYPSRVDDVLFFTGYDGTRVRIGRAVAGAEGFTVEPLVPVIDIGAATDFDNQATAQPYVQHAANGEWRMWYGGYDTSHSNPGPYRIGFATSPDGITWAKQGVVIPLGQSGADAWSTRDPFVFGDTMFYVGLGDDGRYRLHRARR